MILITAPIPTLNRANLVTRAVECALAQSNPAVEVIVLDNGSGGVRDADCRCCSWGRAGRGLRNLNGHAVTIKLR